MHEMTALENLLLHIQPHEMEIQDNDPIPGDKTIKNININIKIGDKCNRLLLSSQDLFTFEDWEREAYGAFCMREEN
jgi:hypothetical protein